MNYGIYIHVPFCRSKCHYCSFYSVPLSSDDVLKAYTDRLGAELGDRLPEFAEDTADTVYFGGGTPSLLPTASIGSLIATIRKMMPLTAETEITVEMNPEDATADKILGFTENGVTRLILGYQTSRQGFHAMIGRSTVLPDRNILDRFFGTGSVVRGMDVMVGLPDQGPDDAADEIDLVAGYCPEHVSVYCLTVEKETELGKRFRAGQDFGARQRECMEAALDRLGAHGYRHYEISNFCRPGFESRHNSKYWSFEPYLGFGPHAHSFYRNVRYYNAMSVEEYLSAPVVDLIQDVRDGRACAVEFIMTGLRMMEGMSLRRLSGATGLMLTHSQWDRARSLRSRGLLDIREHGGDTVFALTREGFFLSDAVIYELVEDLL